MHNAQQFLGQMRLESPACSPVQDRHLGRVGVPQAHVKTEPEEQLVTQRSEVLAEPRPYAPQMGSQRKSPRRPGLQAQEQSASHTNLPLTERNLKE